MLANELLISIACQAFARTISRYSNFFDSRVRDLKPRFLLVVVAVMPRDSEMKLGKYTRRI